MARYPSGITPLPGADVDDVRTRLAQMMLAMDEHPLGTSAPCLNPECAGPVDYLGTGVWPLYCSNTCRSRASTLRGLAQEQLDLIERTLAEAHYKNSIPREELRRRSRLLGWWVARLAAPDEPTAR